MSASLAHYMDSNSRTWVRMVEGQCHGWDGGLGSIDMSPIPT